MLPSEEQKNIIKNIEKYNITVDACAGSGKSSSVIFISKEYNDKKILLLTYNSQLKNEMRTKTIDINNIDVHSYHSFCTTYYDKNAYTDVGMNEIMVKNKEPIYNFNYDIIVADEAQDITPLIYSFLCKIFNDNKKELKDKNNFKIMIMGDKMQSIYKFREADSRYITMSEKVFNNFNNYEWKNMKLSESFRCTIQMIDFLNNCCIGYNRIKSTKNSKYKPEYIICNSYGNEPRKVLEKYLNVYDPKDIFVLAYSIKDKTPIKTLANYVTNNIDVPIFCSSSDQEALDSRVIEGKLVFTTIHQAKGRERKAVIVMGFDESYFEYYDKNSNKTLLPNELYVALTRASERLAIIHDQKKNYLDFIDIELLKKYTSYKCAKKINITKGLSFKDITYSVSELISYLPFSIENMCLELIDVKILKKEGIKINISNVVKIGDLYESVSDISGIAIPAYFEHKVNGISTIANKNLIEKNINLINISINDDETKIKLITKLKKISKVIEKFYNEHIKNIDLSKPLSVENLLKISLYYSVQQNKTEYKLKQINVFDWLSEDVLKEGVERLLNVIGDNHNLYFEESVEKKIDDIILYGEIDCIDENKKIVYEFKCTKTLTSTNIIQLALYLYLNGNDYTYKLYNILSDELYEIHCSKENLDKLIKILIEHKISENNSITDEEFLEKLKIY